MAAKYWYVANNGSSNWTTAGVWYNGPGGTGGTTTTPTAADDAYLTASSGSGTLTMSAATACLSLDCTGFTGTLTNSGGFGLTVTSLLTFSPTMTVSHTGLTTIIGSSGTVNCSGNSFAGNVTFNNASATFFTTDFKTVSTATVTLSAGTLVTTTSGAYTEWALECGLFVSTGTGVRAFWSNNSGAWNWKITGIGTCWNVSGSNITCWWSANSSIVGDLHFTNSTSAGKTITHTLTGNNVPAFTYIEGTGSGTFTISSYLYYLYVTNTGGATIAFGTTMTIVVDLYFDPTSNVNWNSSATTLTFNGFTNITLSPNMTITNSGTISITGLVSLYSNGKSLVGNVTVNSPSYGLTQYDDMKIVGTLTLTAGTIQSYGGDTYVNILSSSNSNARALYLNDLYLTGTGTLVTATTTTSLTVAINNIRVSGSSSVARTLSPNAVFYPLYAVYLGGTGGSTITLGGSTVGTFDVYVTNTGGASISFSTGTIRSLEFSSGTNAIWTNAASQTLTVTGNVFTIASSAGTPTLTPSLIFNGANVLGSGSSQVFVTLNGKSLRTGTVVINDSAVSPLFLEAEFDGFSSNAAFTITSASNTYFTGPFSGTTFTSTACSASTFASSLTLTGAMTLANSLTTYNDVTVLGNLSVATISHSSFGSIVLYGPTNNVTTSITLNNTNPAYFYNFGTLTTPTFTITNGFLASYATLNVTGTLTFSIGTITITGSYNYNLGAFASSGSGVRTLTMGSGTWTLTGTGTVWNLVSTNLTFDAGLSTINITNSSGTSVTFTGGGGTYYTLQFNRGATGSNTIAGSNTFINFIDIGTAAHSLLFTAGTTQTVGNFVVNGATGNLITLNSTTTAAFTLIKSPAGVVNCDYLNIQHSIATSSTGTWYAGTNSVNNQAVATAGSGWIFTNMPPRKLGAGGVG